MRRTIAAATIAAMALLGTPIAASALSTGPDATSNSQISQPKRIKPGTVRTSTGRTVKVNAKTGCLFLTYAELGDPEAGDPGDGEYFCAK